MNHGRIQLAEGELREPKKKKVKQGTLIRDPYPIIFWNKLGIPPCKELWPGYMGFFDGDSVIVEDPEDMHDISTMGYFGKRLMCRRGYEQSIEDVPVVRERQWKRRVEWAAECGYILVPPDKESLHGSPCALATDNNTESDGPQKGEVEGGEVAAEECEVLPEEGDRRGGEELGSVATSGCGSSEQAANTQLGEWEERRESEECMMVGKEGSSHGPEAQVSGEGVWESSGAQGSSRELRGQQGEPTKECSKTGEGKGDMSQDGRRDQQLDRLCDKRKDDGGDCEEAAVEDEGMGETVGGEKGHGEETNNEKVQPCEVKGETAMEVSTVAASSEGGEVDQLGEDGESPASTSSRHEEHLEGEGANRETESCSNSVEAEARKGVGLSGGEEEDLGGLKGEVGGLRKSPRWTRSSAPKLEGNESKICGSLGGGDLTGSNQGVARGQAGQSLMKTFAQEGAGATSDCKGDSSSEGTLSDGKQSEDDKGKENLAISVGKAIEEVEGEKASSSKSVDKSNAGVEILNDEVDDSMVEGEKAGKTCMDGAKGEDQRTLRGCSRKGRAAKRNWTPSSDGISPGKAEEEGRERSEERMSEDVSKDATKRVKVSECEEEEQREQQQPQEEVIVRVTKGGISGTGGDDTRTEEEPEMAQEAIEKEGSSSPITSVEEAEKLCAGGKSAEEKNEDASLNKGSSDCEIVEIEDEVNCQNPFPPVSKIPSAGVLTSTPHKLSKDSLKKDVPCATAADSDDDIMEVSVEEEEVREVARDGLMIVNRRKSNSGMLCDGMASSNAIIGKNESDKMKFQKMLKEIRKTLPRDIEVMQVNLKDLREGEVTTKGCPKAVAATSNNDNDDDDVIEINLQKSDMMELEGYDEEENGGDDGDDEVDCRGEQTKFLRRRMHKESSGFRRKERLREGTCGDPLKMKQEVEVEGTESITTGNLGSDCEVAPCIVIPDSDSEAEGAPGSPRLESDPSVFLPSLDILQLIQEEAFFLAYGLGCLVVWDVRNVEPNKYDHHEAGGSTSINETLGKDDCSDDLQLNHSTKKDGRGLGKETVSNKPSSSTLDGSDPIDHGEDSSLKSVNGCDSGYHPGSPHKGSAMSPSANHENVENAVDPSKLDLTVESGTSNKSSVNKNELSPSHETYVPMEAPPGTGTDSTDVGKEGDGPMDKTSEEEIGVLSVTNKSDQVPIDSHGQQNKDDLEPSINKSLNIVYDIGSSNKATSEPRNHKTGGGEKNNPFSAAEKRDGIRDSCVSPKENGDVSITVIDLIDSPPSRQWARKGWSSQDEEEVVSMDTDSHDVSFIDPESSVPDHTSRRTLSSEYQRPMSIAELWNAFRSCRASVSPSALPFETTYAVYHHFRSKRWVVKPGIRFGGDFLLYKDGPPFYHASYLVVIDSSGPDGESKFDWKMLSGMNRLTENIAKDLMLCRVEWPPSITEEELLTPQCLTGLVIQEVLVRRWVSIRERDADDQLEDDDDDQESFIPLRL